MGRLDDSCPPFKERYKAALDFAVIRLARPFPIGAGPTPREALGKVV